MTEQEKLLHSNRIMFAILGERSLKIARKGDKRGHKEWLRERYHIKSDKQFNDIVRGYYKLVENNIVELVYYTGGDNFSPCYPLENKIMKKLIYSINKRYKEAKIDKIIVYTGMVKGEIGKPWEKLKVVQEIEYKKISWFSTLYNEIENNY